MKTGVLALQGDFALHLRSLRRLGVDAVEVRTARDLAAVDALVLPGGESTTMLKLMEREAMEPAIRAVHDRGGALFGTCAGLILLARGVANPAQRSLGLLDVDVARNGWGRQVDSFETDLAWRNGDDPLRGVFIRAPRITRLGAGVEVLARFGEEPILVREGRVLAATFHPEATDDLRIHRYFIENVAGGRVTPPVGARRG